VTVDIHVPPFVSNLELQWEEPAERRYFERLASFSRLILFDKRGTGPSDRVAVATLEERMDDLRAVMDDVGSKRDRALATALAGTRRKCGESAGDGLKRLLLVRPH
jgi:pimeloyl-ACP methyl ester carboxylesterase